MNREILKPTKAKILVSWLIMSVAIIVVVGVTNWREIADGAITSANVLITLAIVLVAFFQSLIFCLVFYNLPYFKIEVNNTHIIGPRGLGFGWQRIEMPLDDIDVRNINNALQWLGLYIIRSKAGEKLSVWGFDEKQFNRLLSLVTIKARGR